MSELVNGSDRARVFGVVHGVAVFFFRFTEISFVVVDVLLWL